MMAADTTLTIRRFIAVLPQADDMISHHITEIHQAAAEPQVSIRLVPNEISVMLMNVWVHPLGTTTVKYLDKHGIFVEMLQSGPTTNDCF